MTIKITRTDKSSNDLRKLARKCGNVLQSSRLFAIAEIMDGTSREDAAIRHGMTRQTLRDWVHRFNGDGVDGLKDRHRSGRKPRLNEAQKAALSEAVRDGPTLEKDGIARWRQVDLQDWLLREQGVKCHERTVGKWLNNLGFAHITARPKHLKNDSKAIETFKKTLPIQQKNPSRITQRIRRSKSGFKTRHASDSKEI